MAALPRHLAQGDPDQICAQSGLPHAQVVLFGEGELEPSKDNAMLLVEESCSLDLPLQLCQKMALLDFEARKDAAQVRPHGAPRQQSPGAARIRRHASLPAGLWGV